MKRVLIVMVLLAGSVHGQQPCPGFANCLYTGPTYAFNRSTQRITYTDVAGRPRTVEVTLRIPSRTGALPVIIWAHGGADGRNGQGASVGALSVWSEITAGAGLLTVSPAFSARDEADHAALCQFLGAEGTACERFNSPSWDRPYDIRAIIDALESQNRSGPLAGRIDLGRIAVGGHSAGSSGTLSVAGAARHMIGKRYGASYFGDPRPKAFIALSPSAPGFSYLFDRSFNDETTSWDNIGRPVLWLTGAGDGHEQFPNGRRIGYDYLPPGDKYRLWVDDVDFSHGAFGDDLLTCGEGVAGRKCEAFQAALVSVVRAFLDGYLEQKAQALDYLRSGYIEQASRVDRLLQWDRK